MERVSKLKIFLLLSLRFLVAKIYENLYFEYFNLIDFQNGNKYLYILTFNIYIF